MGDPGEPCPAAGSWGCRRGCRSPSPFRQAQEGDGQGGAPHFLLAVTPTAEVGPELCEHHGLDAPGSIPCQNTPLPQTVGPQKSKAGASERRRRLALGPK